MADPATLSPPPLTPWWFYTSPLPLDDPLSPLPITTSATSSIKHRPQPFSLHDVKALEKAYQSLLVSDAPSADSTPTQQTPNNATHNASQNMGGKVVQTTASRRPVHVRHDPTITEQREYAEEGRGHDVLNAPIQRPGITSMATSNTNPMHSLATERNCLNGLIIRGRTLGRSTTNLIRSEELLARQLKQDEQSPPPTTMDNRRRRRSSSPEVNPWTGNPITSRTSDYSTAESSPAGPGIHPPPQITSNPFIRSLSLSRGDRSRSPSPSLNGNVRKRQKASSMSSVSSVGESPEREPSSPIAPPPVKQVEIPVGIQRLHKVLLPSLTMAPIYWNPVHDVSGVLRATWFYRDTMLPVETDMANRLESGYCEVRAWTEEWEAELESAVQVGREGEEKVRWKLWDTSSSTGMSTPVGGSRPSTSAGRTAPMDIGKSRRFEVGSKPATPNARKGIFASYGSSWGSASPGSRFGTPPVGVSAAMIPPSTTMASVTSSVPLSTSAASGDPFAEPTPVPSTNSAGMSASAIPNPNDWVIFANAREAYICRDTMLGFGNRRPLATIRSAGKDSSNVNVGIRVVRGFDIAEWERLNPKRRISGFRQKENIFPAATGPTEIKTELKEHLNSASTETAETSKEAMVEPDEDEPDGRQEVSDLILVIHGIGQKLSERVESFHFTHSMNSFRRLMNTELRDPAVKPQLRDPSKGIMVLPVNWRSGLSLEDGEASAKSSAKAKIKNPSNFTLESITLPTIPAVRNLIGDVMLDIPYYLSPRHKGRMIDAVVREANRVYGLWIHHNPGWEEKGGRVHIIAHSLGSAIALDVLSNQPDRIAEWRKERELSKSIDEAEMKATVFKGCYGCSGRGKRERSRSRERQGPHDCSENRFFDFDTTNLFCAGSPAGFFLLLNHGMLLPRRGRKKAETHPGAETDSNVVGERGMYGCLSVDNVYNIMHYSDPIAYRLNPTVDTEYADNIKVQPIPSATTTLFGSIGSTLRSVLPGTTTTTANTTADSDILPSVRPMPNLTRLPSTIELETHDFSREDITEKRMYLLNDNGTMDWYVGNSGGWVLENQYLNMLGAHSSYWESKDFARFIVGESGRPEGRKGVREGVRAVKVRLR